MSIASLPLTILPMERFLRGTFDSPAHLSSFVALDKYLPNMFFSIELLNSNKYNRGYVLFN